MPPPIRTILTHTCGYDQWGHSGTYPSLATLPLTEEKQKGRVEGT